MEPSTRAHFERLATGWSAKYAPGGSMLPRVRQFLDALRDACSASADVLDFGCGPGQIAMACAQSGYRVHGVDMSPRMIEAAQKGDIEGLVSFSVLSEAEPLQLPFAGASFDAIVASSVFEYVANPAHCFVELHRVSRPGGWMLLTVPNVSHRVRKLERFIKPAARLSGPFLRGAARNWQEYLSLSRQRHSPAEWSRQLANSGWAVRSTQGQNSALLMIVAQSC
jgi:ubiquinone/menaquinone biosynthesis C-methylase UbiE